MVLELIKLKKNQQFAMEVIRIDPENDRIITYSPNNGKGCVLTNRPTPVPFDKSQYSQYEYKTLPKNYWKKYELASKCLLLLNSFFAQIY